ncbi:MAG: TVP38/TMEM64 family protein [Acidobacteria bacterium]|nr:TVP38/TMEM64 family protein [Acidobacteriota bacterium]
MTKTRVLIIVLVVATLAAAAFLLPIKDWTIQLAEWARGTGALGVTVFVLAYIVSTVLGLPGSILTLAAGFAYGPVWGLAIASPASVAGATCAFLLGRTLLHDWAVRRVGESARIRAIDAAVAREGFKLVFLLRLSPLFPFNVLNYALSLSRVSLLTYVTASFLGMLPGTAMYVYLGSLAPAAAELSSASQGGGAARTALYAAGLVATIAVAVLGTRAARRALDPKLAEAS